MSEVKLDIKDKLKDDALFSEVKISGTKEDVRKIIRQLAETF